MDLIKNIVENYNYVFFELQDQRTKDWLFMPGPVPIFTIVGSYLYFCLKCGPRYMKDRKPFELKTPVMLYNVFQILFSTFLFLKGVDYIFSSDFKYYCDDINYSDTPRAIDVAAAVWFYFFAKVTELVDTIFFVLRKKNSQVTFLHVYHHSLMVLATWMGARYFPGGPPIVMGVLNSFVHIVMYTYYLIAGLGPEYQKYVWWKKHVTTLQLVQFCLIFMHNITPFFDSGCEYPKILHFVLLTNAVVFMYLFGKFFVVNYIRNNKVSSKNGKITNGEHRNGEHDNDAAHRETTKNGDVRNGKVKCN